jgi:hypothetical protein
VVIYLVVARAFRDRQAHGEQRDLTFAFASRRYADSAAPLGVLEVLAEPSQ